MTMIMNDSQIKTRQESVRKIDYINYLISKTEMAGEDDPEFYSKKKRIIVDFSPVHSWQEQKAWLSEFKDMGSVLLCRKHYIFATLHTV